MQTKIDLQTPFKSRSQALEYIRERNPARAKFSHRFEPEHSRSTLIIDDFSGVSATDRFVRAIHAVACVLADEPHERAQAWCLRNMIPRAEGGGLHVDDIASRFGRSRRSIHRWLNRIDDYLDEEMVRRQLIPDDPTSR